MAIFLGFSLLLTTRMLLGKYDTHRDQRSKGDAGSDDDPHRVVTDDMFSLD
jgi:hypothetical protein